MDVLPLPNSSQLPMSQSELDRLTNRKTELHEDYFHLIPNVLVNHIAKKLLKPIDMVVYMVLKDYQGQNDRCWASNQSVARLCGRDVSSVKRSIQRLMQAGHIQRREKELGATAFTFFPTTVIDGKVKRGTPPIIPQLPELSFKAPSSQMLAPVDAKGDAVNWDFGQGDEHSGPDSAVSKALEHLQKLKVEPLPIIRGVQSEKIDLGEDVF